MRAAICSVGDELLLGDQTDSNATWLSAQLAALGVEVVRHVAVGDERDELAGTLGWLAQRADVVLIGGGLGPTPDDLTREAMAVFAGVDLVRDDGLAQRLRDGFAARGWHFDESNLQQADVPVGAEVLAPQGTAPGLWLDVESHAVALVALPGVPWEQRAMFTAEVVPRLRARGATRSTVTAAIRVVGRSEAEVGQVAAKHLDGPAQDADVRWSILAGQGEIRVRASVTGDDEHAAMAAATALLAPVRDALGVAVVGDGGATLEAEIRELLVRRGETVAFAESATAGALAARLASVPGASEVLLGGLVVYATRTKHELAGVDPELLGAHGPVSAETTEALAVGVRTRLAADWGVAVTGVAGPAEQDGIPVGTAFWCVVGPGGVVQAGGRQLPGDRATVQARLVGAALDALRRALSDP